MGEYCDFQVSTKLSVPPVLPTRSQCASCCIVVQLLVQSRKNPSVSWEKLMEILQKVSTCCPVCSGPKCLFNRFVWNEIQGHQHGVLPAVEPTFSNCLFFKGKHLLYILLNDFSKKPRSFVSSNWSQVRKSIPEFGLLLATSSAYTAGAYL